MASRFEKKAAKNGIGEVNKSNSGAAEHESAHVDGTKVCFDGAEDSVETAVRQCESGWGNVGLGEYGKYKGV